MVRIVDSDDTMHCLFAQDVESAGISDYSYDHFQGLNHRFVASFPIESLLFPLAVDALDVLDELAEQLAFPVHVFYVMTIDVVEL